MTPHRTTGLVISVLIAQLCASCGRVPSDQYQGYLEGEFIYTAAPSGGYLEVLYVRRGDVVAAGDRLFALDATPEIAAKAGSLGRLREATARWEDLRKGLRPSELAAIEAGLEKARVARELSALELARARELVEQKAIPIDQLDRARLAHDQNEQVVIELGQRLETARLGGRESLLAAAAAAVEAARAGVQAAAWSLEQKIREAPSGARVHDTLYVEGEWVPAGRPVVMLLPPENIHVRFFVPEGDLHRIRTGNAIEVVVSGRESPLTGRITYLSTKPEFTPPVLYNRENRAKLVFMVEGSFEPDIAATLHPGQPVDVRLVTVSPDRKPR